MKLKKVELSFQHNQGIFRKVLSLVLSYLIRRRSSLLSQISAQDLCTTNSSSLDLSNRSTVLMYMPADPLLFVFPGMIGRAGNSFNSETSNVRSTRISLNDNDLCGIELLFEDAKALFLKFVTEASPVSPDEKCEKKVGSHRVASGRSADKEAHTIAVPTSITDQLREGTVRSG